MGGIYKEDVPRAGFPFIENGVSLSLQEYPLRIGLGFGWDGSGFTKAKPVFLATYAPP